MGKQTSIHTYKGRIDNVVGYNGRNGEMLERKYRANINKSMTERATTQRAKFKLLVEMCYAVGLIMSNLYAYKAKKAKTSVRNQFIKYNMAAITGDSPESLMADYSVMFDNPSSLGNVTFGGARFDETLTVKASFASNLSLGDEDDSVFLGVYSPEMNECVVSSATTLGDSHIDVTVPATWNGTTVHVWGWTKATADYYNEATASSIKRGMTSTAQYIGNGTIS